MRPIPAPRLGDAHGLLRAIGERGRLRLDEFITDFTVEELFPPGLENALGRTRQFVSFARAAGLVNEDRGTVELTEMGKRYVRAGDASAPFDVVPAQAEWLRRLLRERHMTDSIYNGAAIALSLYASSPPDFRASTLDFGRALNQLGRVGWDSDNTFQSQGERYTTFLTDLELIDGQRRLTAIGQETLAELTLPIHESLKDLAGRLNPGGLEGAVRDAEGEFAPSAAVVEEDEYEDVGPSPVAAPGPPTPPPGVWESGPEERTQAYQAIGVEPPAVETPGAAAPVAPRPDEPVESAPPTAPPPAVETPVPAAAAPAAPTADAPVEGAPPTAPPPAVETPGAAAPAAPPTAAAPDQLAAATVASAPPIARPAPPVSAAAIGAAAQEAGLRLPPGVHAAVAAALARGHVVLVGPAGCGKTTLALAIAKAAAQAGRASGATLVTAAHRWSSRDTVGRPAEEEWQRGAVLDAASRGRWLVIDELDRARLDRALGELSSYLGGAPVALPEGEVAAPDSWRIVATATARLDGSPALVRRFAHVHVPPPGEPELAAAIDAAAGGDATAAAAVKRLLGARDVGPVGTGAFLDAVRFAADRNAAAPADEATLAREALAAHVEPLLGRLDEDARARLLALAGGAR